jgi:endogenous inhibitor of DNA gyrase (YacG/DUF329 family)
MTSTSQSNLNAKQVACPTCKKLASYNINNPYRPFCSQRCKMIDLGDWANENFRIPANKPLNNDPLGNDDDLN